MNEAAGKTPRKMPKGGRKGGAQFPRSPLADALKWAAKLVAKTHANAMARDAVFAGVVGAKGGNGNVRISTLKQYGYLEGKPEAYTASALAKKTIAAPADEVIPLYRQAALKPAVFKALFHTFQADTVTRAKLRQRAADLNVHPEETDGCVENYLSTMKTAKLVEIDGEGVIHTSLKDHPSSPGSPEGGEAEGEDSNGEKTGDSSVDEAAPSTDGDDGAASEDVEATKRSRAPGARAVFNVNVTLDSSLDIEKLHRQLELLKKFGAI